jgi:imidazolonepropionase-like amidohydrolase
MKNRWRDLAEASPPGFCLVNARLIDGLGNPPLEDGYVQVEEGRFARVGPVSDLPRPSREDRPRIDLEGQTILPGLIDCHAHLVYSGFRRLDELDRCSVETCTINAVRNAEAVLRAGYTTIRDLGTVGNVAVAVRDAIAHGKIRGPRVVASGRILSSTGGHVDTLPAWWENRGGLGVRVDGPDDVIRAVRQQVKDGVDNIKLGASGAEVSPYAHTWMTTMNEEEIRAAVHEAHRWGRTVAVHCQSYDAVKFALRAGADTVEHGTRLDDEAIELFRASETFLVPTLCTLYSVLELGARLDLMPKQREEMEVNRPLWVESFRRAHEAGVPIATGGDIGNRYPHGTNAREIELLVGEGMTPLEAIRAATSTAARAIRREDRGSLEPGKLADLIVLDGDPLADIRVLQDQARIRAIVKGGRIVAGASLERADA